MPMPFHSPLLLLYNLHRGDANTYIEQRSGIVLWYILGGNTLIF